MLKCNQIKTSVIRINITEISNIFASLYALQHLNTIRYLKSLKIKKEDIIEEVLSLINSTDNLVRCQKYNLITCVQDGSKLYEVLIEVVKSDVLCDKTWESLIDAVIKFRLSLQNEIAVQPIYLATAKGCYDVNRLSIQPEILMPLELLKIIPEATNDLVKCSACLVASLPEACIFHLMKILEITIIKYCNDVLKIKEKQQNLGKYIEKIEGYFEIKNEISKNRLLSMLKSIKNNIRNPIIHPDLNEVDIEDALNIVGSTREVISLMLKEFISNN